MFPWVYEFHWSLGQILFLGIFFTVLATVFSTFVLAAMKSRRDFKLRRAEAIQWKVDFEDLPSWTRSCRHELTGEMKQRTCHNDFDCRTCVTHLQLLARQKSSEVQAVPETDVSGFDMSLDRMYHRGHSWVKQEDDGSFTIGIDGFIKKLLGEPEAVNLPEIGTPLQANGTGWKIVKHGRAYRMLSPVDGVVAEKGSMEKGWLLKIRSQGSDLRTDHLLRGNEIRPWIMREFERVQFLCASGESGPALADGGELIPDVAKQYPQIDWDAVYGHLMLQS